jgi:hypothetical protein
MRHNRAQTSLKTQYEEDLKSVFRLEDATLDSRLICDLSDVKLQELQLKTQKSLFTIDSNEAIESPLKKEVYQ